MRSALLLLPALQKWQLDFWSFCIFLSIICPNCACTQLFLVPYGFFVFCFSRRRLSRCKHCSRGSQVPAGLSLANWVISPMQPCIHPDEQMFLRSQVRHWMGCWGYTRVITSLWLNKQHQNDSIVIICGFAQTNSWVAVFGRDMLNSDNGETLFDHIPTYPVPVGISWWWSWGSKGRRGIRAHFECLVINPCVLCAILFRSVSNHRFVSLLSKYIFVALTVFFRLGQGLQAYLATISCDASHLRSHLRFGGGGGGMGGPLLTHMRWLSVCGWWHVTGSLSWELL